MPKIASFDVPTALSPWLPTWTSSIAVGVLCAGTIGILRLPLDAAFPGVMPFVLVFPLVLLATLIGRWSAGLTTTLIVLVVGWYVILPARAHMVVSLDQRPAMITALAISALLTIAIAERYRRGVRRTAAERDRQIAERDLFLAEFEHRVKNNFAIVASLLELQRRRADPATAEALGQAVARIDSIARAPAPVPRCCPAGHRRDGELSARSVRGAALRARAARLDHAQLRSRPGGNGARPCRFDRPDRQ